MALVWAISTPPIPNQMGKVCGRDRKSARMITDPVVTRPVKLVSQVSLKPSYRISVLPQGHRARRDQRQLCRCRRYKLRPHPQRVRRQGGSVMASLKSLTSTLTAWPVDDSLALLQLSSSLMYRILDRLRHRRTQLAVPVFLPQQASPVSSGAGGLPWRAVHVSRRL